MPGLTVKVRVGVRLLTLTSAALTITLWAWLPSVCTGSLLLTDNHDLRRWMFC